MKNSALYFVGENQIDIIDEPIPKPKKDEVLVKNRFSAISAGTEMLFYRGLVPAEISLDASISSLKHPMAYPFKYGYCSLGQIVDVGNKKDNHLLNRSVFAFNPHESYFCVKESDLILLPEEIGQRDALFIANMETAINFVLDGSPLIGENVVILGLGIVGLLTTALLKQFPLSTLIGIDFYQNRCQACLDIGANTIFKADQSDLEFELQKYLQSNNQNHIDLIYELTGNPSALNSAISFSCYEGRIVLGSWYGKKTDPIYLGGKFHRNRIKLIASQVSSLASELQGRWDKSRRFATVLDSLRIIKPSQFITHEFNIMHANKAYELLQNNPQDALQVILIYEE